MVVERIPIKFNKYVFDNFYSEKKTWPYIFIYSFVTRKKLLQVNRNCQIYYPDIKVDCYTAIEVESDVRLTYFEEDMFIFGLIMLGLLVIDIYLTIDYISSLSHREKVEESLKYDNLRASEIRQRYDELSAPERRTYRPHSVPRRAKGESIREEEDLSDVLSRREANQTGTARR